MRKKYWGLVCFIIIAIVSIIIDVMFESTCSIFNEINRMLFTLVSVIAGFWVTCYLLFLEMYKDRYPLKFVQKKYLPQIKYNMSYIIYCIVFGCFIVIKNGGLIENIWYATASLVTIFMILKNIYDTSKTIMVNTYIDDFCEEIMQKINNLENSVMKEGFNDIRFVLDECIVKEEYYVFQNISIRLGDIFRGFLENSIRLVVNGEGKNSIEETFDKIVDVGLYQLELCKDINSELLIEEIAKQQIDNIKLCIKANQYEWFKKYIESMSVLTFHVQKEEEDKVVSVIFRVYTNILKELVRGEREEWICYMMNTLYSMTTSLNFLSSNINLKYYSSLIVYGLLKCKEGKIYDSLYEYFEDVTGVACRINKGFSDIKVYYALYFSEILKNNNNKLLLRFFKTIFRYGQDRGNDITWTEFKFYCIKEVLERKVEVTDLNVNKYHIRLLVEVIEMKGTYSGYMFLPQFQKKFIQAKNEKALYEEICEDIKYLFNQCIINDNLNLFFAMLKNTSGCLKQTEQQNKEVQIAIFGIFTWLIERTSRVNNKQFEEMTFIELENILCELDKNKKISKDFGDIIITELTDLAKQSNSDSYNVVIHVIDLFSAFLKETKELQFVNNYPERKEKLYKGLFNIATNCIENDYEEGVRRCSNAIGWFTIHSIKQSNVKLTKYLIKLAKGMLDIAIEMNVTTKTQAFILTLFTTVGMYCCKEQINFVYVDSILEAIQRVDKNLIYTAIKIRTYENDMWDSLLENNTQYLTTKFRKKYDDYQRKNSK